MATLWRPCIYTICGRSKFWFSLILVFSLLCFELEYFFWLLSSIFSKNRYWSTNWLQKGFKVWNLGLLFRALCILTRILNRIFELIISENDPGRPAQSGNFPEIVWNFTFGHYFVFLLVFIYVQVFWGKLFKKFIKISGLIGFYGEPFMHVYVVYICLIMYLVYITPSSNMWNFPIYVKFGHFQYILKQNKPILWYFDVITTKNYQTHYNDYIAVVSKQSTFVCS